MKKRTIYLLVILLTQLSNFVGGAIPAAEREALIALYNSTNGDTWSNHGGWKTPPLHTDGFAVPGTEGSWSGITLSGDNVYSIDLTRNDLRGSIPPELGNLSKLQYLYLGSNQLNGRIPPELGKLSNLVTLQLYYNQLSDSIPPELGNLGNLYRLNLNNNELSGKIPSELGNLSNLGELSLHKNQLSGSIPPELGKLSNLYNFILGGNQLSGGIPPELGNLRNYSLENFSLSDNQLSGSIPPELGNLGNPRNFSLSHNQLSGSIPPELGNLRVIYLCLDHNRLSGSIPPGLGNTGSLYLYLDHNRLSGSIPAQLGNLRFLYGLGLSHNQLTGSIPSFFKSFENITDLDVGYNCLSASDHALRTWLNSHDPDWKATQCLEKAPPFGYFETPIHNSTVWSSIPVTGWALDDYGMDSVKIYRAQEKSLVFIGDAVFVKGARPDVEAAYPGYPGNDRAGWGYMLLTNCLPNGSNGTYVLHAIATDLYGKTTTLGTKTITVDNAHAVKPFGAIDTPRQGGTASGRVYINLGWVLTPMPNMIPADGTTINVWIDGILSGHPTYNLYRQDIAAIFPGYANSDHAGGRFILDTTAYKNGLHTISWTAADNAGNQDGIGSRFFEILNTDQAAATSGKKEVQTRIPREEPARIPLDYSGPVTLKKGFDRESITQKVYPGDNGITSLSIRELERVVIYLDGPGTAENSASQDYTGYLASGDHLTGLPAGSTLDKTRGIFYWMPGPGFIGTYNLIFINPTGDRQKKITIRILPKN